MSNKSTRGRRPALVHTALALTALCGGLAGCDDAEDNPSEIWSIGFQDLPGQLTCAEDLDRTTDDRLEYDLTVAVAVAKIPSAELKARLSAANGAFEPRTLAVPAQGRVTFAGVPLPLGAVGLTVELLEGDEVRASATGSLVAAIDTTDPSCPEAQPNLTIRFDAPAENAVLTAADDANGDLGDDLQTPVVVGVVGAVTGEVTLTVDGVAAGTANVLNGVATFDEVTLGVGDGSAQAHQLTATLDGVSATRDVTVEVVACSLELLAPAASATCLPDLDANANGVQVELVARSNCSTVSFIANDEDAGTVAVVGGEARQVVTLMGGPNTVAATAATEGGLAGSIDPVTVSTHIGAPRVLLDLEPQADNVLTLANVADGAGPTWRITGEVLGVPDGGQAQLTWSPALDGAPATTVVGAGGDLDIAVTTAAYGCYALTVEVVDACETVGSSGPYTVCFDSVRPTARITAPADGALIGPALDIDPAVPGIQLAATLTVDDARPADVDYALTVVCGPDEATLTQRSAGSVLRSALADGLQFTVQPEDVGTLLCQVRVDGASNPAITPSVTYNVVPVLPTFGLIEPVAGPNGAPVCLTGDLTVDGLGTGLDDFGAALVANVVPEGGEALEPAPLQSLGGERYAIEFGTADGPDALPEGSYAVAVTGTVANGALPVAVSPAAPVTVIIDRTAPTSALVAPLDGAVLTAADDLDGDLANCIQTDLTFGVTDANTAQVCFAINGAAERCVDLDAAGQAVVAGASLLDGINRVTARATDCAGNTASSQFRLETTGCLPRIVVQSPPDGARLAAAVADLDLGTDGIQLDVVLATGLAAGTQVQVQVIDGAVFGPVAVDAQGEATVRVTLDVPVGAADTLTFGLRGRTADGANLGPVSEVVVLFAVPAITLRPVGDCLNAAAPDASVLAGYQVALVADTLRTAPGDAATLTADCGGELSSTEGLVEADGAVRFAPLTVPDEATCALTLQVTDAAGQSSESQASFTVDRVAPTVAFVAPADGALINAFSDQNRDPGAPGIQLAPTVRVCGAEGTNLNLASEQVAALDGQAYPVPAGDCPVVTLDEVTLPEGQLTLTAQAADACGNPAQALTRFTVDSDATLAIVDPTQNGTIRASNEADLARAGCQYTLVASVIGLPAEAEFDVCTTFAQGAATELCEGQSSAVDAMDATGCRFEGGAQALLRCPLNLGEGTHDLTVAARFGDTTRSVAVRVRADCQAPTVASIAVAEAGADACVNRQERLNPADVGDTAAVNVSFAVAGIEDGRFVDVRRAPGATRLTRVAVNGGVATGRITLATNQSYDLYLTGTDAVGNALPAFEPGVNGSTIRVDTRAPAPRLLNLVANGCLNNSRDLSAGDAGLQYSVQVQPNAEVNETVGLRLAVGAEERLVANVAALQFPFEAVTIGEGPQTAIITATDACGNVGSVSGFVQVAGRADWTQPIGVPFRVDTQAPAVTLEGLVADQIYGAADDADADVSNGFQLNLTARIDPAASIEANAEVQFRAEGQRLTTQPATLRVPAMGFDGTVSAPATFSPGPLSVTAQATDTCGNVGTSAPVAITIDVGGCSSRITSLAGDPAILGPTSAPVEGAAVRIDVIGQADLLDLSCAGADAELQLDGALLGTAVVGPDGAIQFTDVLLPEGQGSLTIRIVRPGESTSSLGQSVIVDLTAPSVTIESPAGDPASVLQDADPATPGQQALVSARVVEAVTGSDRTATVAVGGVVQGASQGVAAGSPQLANFTATLPPGSSVIEVCVTDAAGNTGCADLNVDADPASPADITPAVDVVDERLTLVAFTFLMPGDDGFDNGAVVGWEARRADVAINNEAAWDAATSLDGPMVPAVAAGAEQRFETQALALNERHFVAIRAVDDAGRMGAINNVEVDLRLAVRTYTVPALLAPFDGSAVINVPSIVQSVGDVDGDGFDDLLASAAQVQATGASIIFGSADPDQADAALDVRSLQRPLAPAAVFFGVSSAALGDVNGDGAPDFGVVGVAADFSSALAFVYFGCPVGSACTRDNLVQPNLIIRVGRLGYNLAGIGNFTQRAVDVDGGGAPVAIDDIFLGDAVQGGATNAYVIAGRTSWPSATNDVAITINANVLDLAEGRTEIRVPAGLSNGGRTGRVAFRAGDLDGDGFDEVAFTDGTAFDHAFVYYGSNDLPLSYTLAADARNRELAHPCRASGTTFGSAFAGGVDLDNDPDGRPDLLVGDYVGKRVASFDQDLANIECVTRSEGLFGVTLSVGDINGDGFPDLLANHLDTNGRPQDALVFYNDGGGHFGQGVGLDPRVADVRLRTPVNAKQGITASGDFNGDGRIDLAVGAIDAANGFAVVVYY